MSDIDKIIAELEQLDRHVAAPQDHSATATQLAAALRVFVPAYWETTHPSAAHWQAGKDALAAYDRV